MPLKDLLSALEAEADAEHAADQEARAREAASIIADAEASARQEQEAIVAEATAAARDEAQVVLAQAHALARSRLRQARDQAIESVRQAVEARLADLPGSADGNRAAAMCLEEARAALPVARRARLHPRTAPNVPTGHGLDVGADLDRGGAIVEDETGRWVDNTYLRRLENLWPDLRRELSASWDRQP